MKHILPFIPVLFIAACGGNAEQTETNNNDTLAVDSLVLDSNVVIDQDSLKSRFHISSALPYLQDTSYLFDLNGTDSTWLARNQIQYLTYGFVDSDISYQGLIPIDDYFFFDSLQHMADSGAYEEYLAVLDIGMMAQTNAFAAQEVIVDDSTKILLWCVNYSTYEACPYASGTILYGTIVRNGRVTSCTILGEDSSGADAPVWGETLTLCSLSKDKMSAWKLNRNCDGETDEEGNDIVTEFETVYTISIDEKGVWVIEASVVE